MTLPNVHFPFKPLKFEMQKCCTVVFALLGKEVHFIAGETHLQRKCISRRVKHNHNRNWGEIHLQSQMKGIIESERILKRAKYIRNRNRKEFIS
jgi:hypothetical protein